MDADLQTCSRCRLSPPNPLNRAAPHRALFASSDRPGGICGASIGYAWLWRRNGGPGKVATTVSANTRALPLPNPAGYCTEQAL